MTNTELTVLTFGHPAGRTPPRALRRLPAAAITDPAQVDAAVQRVRRVVVVGDDADLATVLTRLMRSERLDVELAHVTGPLAARRALTAPAQRVPLIRDDTGTALVGSASWLPSAGADALHGEAVVDDVVLFDGEVAGVRIEPTATMPGLRAAVLGGSLRRRWVTGRAAQLGTTGARVVRDGMPGPREVTRSTFYRHTTGWLRVSC